MSNRAYKNIMYDSFINKPQVENVMFNKNLCEKIERKDCKKNLGRSIFFIITEWLLSKNTRLKSIYLYGKITKVTPKALEINFSIYIPLSQIRDIYVYVGRKKNQLLLKDYITIDNTKQYKPKKTKKKEQTSLKDYVIENGQFEQTKQ